MTESFLCNKAYDNPILSYPILSYSILYYTISQSINKLESQPVSQWASQSVIH